jgi:hypothetical protein
VRVEQKDVIAVPARPTREGAVVDPEQADHAVWRRAHRLQRADGEVARAEVCAGRAVGQEGGDVCDVEDCLGGGLTSARLGEDVLEHPLQLGTLPPVGGPGGPQGVGGVGDCGRPGGDALRLREVVDDGPHAVDELGETAAEVDGRRVDIG